LRTRHGFLVELHPALEVRSHRGILPLIQIGSDSELFFRSFERDHLVGQLASSFAARHEDRQAPLQAILTSLTNLDARFTIDRSTAALCSRDESLQRLANIP
jgi:hypothetical protein